MVQVSLGIPNYYLYQVNAEGGQCCTIKHQGIWHFWREISVRCLAEVGRARPSYHPIILDLRECFASSELDLRNEVGIRTGFICDFNGITARGRGPVVHHRPNGDFSWRNLERQGGIGHRFNPLKVAMSAVLCLHPLCLWKRSV